MVGLSHQKIAMAQLLAFSCIFEASHRCNINYRLYWLHAKE